MTVIWHISILQQYKFSVVWTPIFEHEEHVVSKFHIKLGVWALYRHRLLLRTCRSGWSGSPNIAWESRISHLISSQRQQRKQRFFGHRITCAPHSVRGGRIDGTRCRRRPKRHFGRQRQRVDWNGLNIPACIYGYLGLCIGTGSLSRLFSPPTLSNGLVRFSQSILGEPDQTRRWFVMSNWHVLGL